MVSWILVIFNERKCLFYFAVKCAILSKSLPFFPLFLSLSSMPITLDSQAEDVANSGVTEHANYLQRGREGWWETDSGKMGNCNIHNFLFFLLSNFFSSEILASLCPYLQWRIRCLHFNRAFLVDFCGVKQTAVLLLSLQKWIH